MLLLPAGAGAAWTTPVTVSPIGDSVNRPRVEVIPDGSGRIAWSAGNVWRAADGTLGAVVSGCTGPAQFLSRLPQFGLDSGGDAIFFSGDDPATTCSVASDDSFTPAVPVSPQNGREARDLSVAVDPSGRTVFAWTVTGWRIQARSMTSSGHLRAIQTLSPLGEIAQDPEVAIAPNGDAYVVWFSRPRQDCCPYTVYGRAIDRNGIVGPLETIADGTYPDVEMDRDGDAVVIWRGGDAIQALRRAADGTFSPAQIMSTDQSGPSSTGQSLALTPSGVATLVWHTQSSEVKLRRLSVAGVPGTPQTIATGGARAPEVGVDQAGNAFVIWEQDVGALEAVQVVQRSPDGTLSPVQTLSDRRSSFPDIAVTPTGAAVATWRRNFSATGDRVQVSAGP